MTPAIDIYAFGMCALEMASLEIQGNGDSGTLVTQDHINRTIESLDDPLQKDLIYQCLTADFEKRPSARTLLFHPVLFEVHALKLLAAHALVKTGKHVDTLNFPIWVFCVTGFFKNTNKTLEQKLFSDNYQELKRYEVDGHSMKICEKEVEGRNRGVGISTLEPFFLCCVIEKHREKNRTWLWFS